MTELILGVIVLLLIANLYFIINGRKDNKDDDQLERNIRDEFARNRVESLEGTKGVREEITNQMTRMSDVQNKQMDSMTRSNEERMDRLIRVLESKLSSLQEDNNKRLDKMQEIVDEKLQTTLEKRLGESFTLVSKRLEEVHKGLGEMQNLATGVGDLKKVLSNVKARGVIGEYQLENILEQILHRDQYEKNVNTVPGTRTHVEFAVKMPGKEDGQNLWLPIDSKFPMEDYRYLLEAYDNGDKAMIELYTKQLVQAIKNFAKDINNKYIEPPYTTDFGVMFLPVEGLYAEVLRQPGLFEIIQREYRVVITGPTTLAALLNSLQMGFRTLAIEQRSGEVWNLLGVVKTEFHKFGEILDKTKKKLQEASNVIDQASSKSRNIEKKLKNVQELPDVDKPKLIVNRKKEDDDLFSSAS